MSGSLNKVMLIGNVGAEPEIRTTSSGTKLAKCSLATNRKWTDRTGQQQEKTEWHRLTFWDKKADIVEQWVSKGDRLYVEGRLEYSQTEGDDGVTRYWTDIQVFQLVMLGSPQGQAASGQRPSQSTSQSTPATAPASSPIDEVEDDLPF